MVLLDLALRGGAVTILILLAGLMWRAPLGLEGRLSLLTLSLTQSSFLIITAAAPLELPLFVLTALTLLASFTPASITWFIVTIFLDAPGRKWPWIIASLATSVAHYIHLTSPEKMPICLTMAVALFGALFVLSLWSSKDDLVECRCRARPGFAAAIAGLAFIISGSQAIGILEANSTLFALIKASSTLFLALVFAIWLLRPDADRWPGEQTSEQGRPPNTIEPSFDPALISRIQAAMSAGIWREEGLSIGALASKLSVPEHRLRRAINQGLGYRNFSSFINKARVEAACSALTDPMQSHVTVLEIAYDVGFASIGPFNRAFRAEKGLSPTEHRRNAFAGNLVDSEQSAPKIANLH